jgi:glucose/arabinose dehydrogenase
LSPGLNPCSELETRAGIWRYDANKTDQVFSASERYATGIRNGEGFGFDKAGHLYVTQHGRDQLSQNWSKLYTVEQGVELPAEEVVELKQGGDYGWPECYYDQNQEKLVLAPEYGGDGGKIVGVCASKQAPAAAFPGHLAPNDLLIYTGTQFPEPYRDGAFIAFHGSWNRAPREQAGYNVVFQPLADGKAAGDSVVFADGFAGAHKDPGRAAFRPSGLAMGPDGALYVGDDVHGRIWRVTYRGDAATRRPRGWLRRRRLLWPRSRAARPYRPKGLILMLGAPPPIFRCRQAPQRIRLRSATASSTEKSATAPAADVTGPMPRGRRSVPT